MMTLDNWVEKPTPKALEAEREKRQAEKDEKARQKQCQEAFLDRFSLRTLDKSERRSHVEYSRKAIGTRLELQFDGKSVFEEYNLDEYECCISSFGVLLINELEGFGFFPHKGLGFHGWIHINETSDLKELAKFVALSVLEVLVREHEKQYIKPSPLTQLSFLQWSLTSPDATCYHDRPAALSARINDTLDLKGQAPAHAGRYNMPSALKFEKLAWCEFNQEDVKEALWNLAECIADHLLVRLLERSATVSS